MTDRPEVNNEISGSVDGVVVQAGSIGGDVRVELSRSVVRSAYLEQVRRIAPAELRERDGELAELAAFCTGPGNEGSAYRWWQAPAWAGKSALMAWFVLHPPKSVRVVSFFVTARYAGQSDRVAFVEVLIEQLAELLGRALPALLTDATREPHLLAMLADAAAACATKGERLVLVVDGLDEDRGVCTGPDVYSIAAMLPSSPPEGLRVVVAGRPHPPVPVDVPADHPLRDPSIVRVLDRSARAAVVQVDARRELLRLEHGTAVEQDLLGLVATAGGGLSGADLVALSGARAWEVEEHLGAVSGRAFARRTSHYRPGSGPDVYVLGHEELQNSAVEFLGPQRRAGYLQRLNDWADGYREQGWPVGTPEYLLRGYLRLLRDSGDTNRMVACATDRARHDRMLDISGGDTVALTEITSTQDFLLARGEPDLLAMARLALHRDTLTARNTYLPTNLPAVWVALGQPARALALARSVADAWDRDTALGQVACAHAALGDVGRAEGLIDTITGVKAWHEALIGFIKAAAVGGRVDRAEAVAQDLMQNDDSKQRNKARIALAEAMVTGGDHDRAVVLATEAPACDSTVAVLVAVGDLDRAETVARSISDDVEQAQAMGRVLGAVFAAGDVDRAEAVARSVAREFDQKLALTTLADVVATLGLDDRANAIRRTISGHSFTSVAMLAEVLKAITVVGDLDKARVLVRHSEAMNRPYFKACEEDVAPLLPALVALGEIDRAADLARDAADEPAEQARMLAAVAAATAAVDVDRAGELAAEAGDLARTTPSTRRADDKAIAALATALAKAGDLDRVEDLLHHSDILRAWSDRSARPDAQPLIGVVVALAKAGDVDRAETFARSDTSDQRNRMLLTLVRTLGISGAVERAEAIAETLGYPLAQTEALLSLVHVVVESGDAERARAVAQRIDAIAHALPDGHPSAARAQVSAVEAQAAVGDLHRAESVARAVVDPYYRPLALTGLARKMAAVGDLDRARALVRLAYTGAVPEPVPWGAGYPVAEVARAIAAVGDFDRAEELARTPGEYGSRKNVLIAVITELVSAGQVDRAVQLAGSITEDLTRSSVLEALAETLIAAGDLDRAEAVAQTIPFPSARGRAWVVLVKALVTKGDLSRARLVVDRVTAIPDAEIFAHIKGWLLAGLVRALPADFAGADVLARSIAHPDQQAEALTALAETTPSRTADLLGRAFRVGHWSVPLRALVHIDPATAPVIADEFQALNRLPTEAQVTARQGPWTYPRRQHRR